MPCFHRHTFKVNKDQLLAIYNHVLEVRVWNTKSKLSPKAKYDRPKAFRVPVKRINSKGEAGTDLDSKDVPGIIQRPSKFSVVYHDQVRKMKMNRRMSGKLATTLQTQTLMPTERLGVNMNPDETGGSIGKWVLYWNNSIESPFLLYTILISRCQGYSRVIKVIQFLPVYIIIITCRRDIKQI